MPRCSTSVGFILALAVPLVPVSAQVEHIRVAISVTDSTNQIASALGGALRQLGDVDLVSDTEDPQYVLEVIALCIPSCANLTNYGMAFRFYSPVSKFLLAVLSDAALPKAATNRERRRDSLMGVFRRIIDPYHYQQNLRQWVAISPRSGFVAFLLEQVREIDYLCFDRVRAEARLFDRSAYDSVAFNRYLEFRQARKWLC